jgi:hypothetical protein
MNNLTKKMTMIATVAIVACSLAMAADKSSSQETSPSWLGRLFERMSWEKGVATADCPKCVATLVYRHIRFDSNLGERWSDGKATWDRGFGDCKAMATAVTQMCKEAGIDANVTILVFSTHRFEGHAVATGTWKGRMWISSNGCFEYVDSIQHAAELVAKEMGWNGCVVSITPLDNINRNATEVATTGVNGTRATGT